MVRTGLRFWGPIGVVVALLALLLGWAFTFPW